MTAQTHESDLLDYVRILEGSSSFKRKQALLSILQSLDISPTLHRYRSGENILIQPTRKPFVAIGSHFDVVPNSPGANDNASAMAVTLGVMRHFQAHPTQHIGVAYWIFDEEETGLKGSSAYVREHGTDGLIALANLELVGMGEQLAIWPLQPFSRGVLVDEIESSADHRGIAHHRFNQIILNTADHESFHLQGFPDAFTLTAVSQEDLEVAQHFIKAQSFDVDRQTLWSILGKAPLVQHYHQPSDQSIHLSESSLQWVTRVLIDAIEAVDAQFGRG
ncbi:M28 family peptidase [Pontibacter sp. G13]|uniref:M28 family peptidase n=1 Tax=Pontibacter sp. G13 TaxID=3074898 RepID=UPI00288A02D3|nr:M28 family peptidase [Pontibacter sp. G13]WNJ18612.1 M28 family peptidase [Pontibacter sp. G13]